MSADIVVFAKPRTGIVTKEYLQYIEQMLLPLEEICGNEVRELINKVARKTLSTSKWTFVMLSPDQNRAVVSYLREHARRPLVAMELWAMCFQHLDMNTGEIGLTRDQMAAEMSVTPSEVSRIMGDLVKQDAIITKRRTIAGMRGPGIVRYFMNPLVATHLPQTKRDEAQSKAPKPKAAVKHIQHSLRLVTPA